MSATICGECLVCAQARSHAELFYGAMGPNLNVGPACDTCGITLLWALWAGLVDVEGDELLFAVTALFAGLINKDEASEEDMVCDTCCRADRRCIDCCSPAKAAAIPKLLGKLKAMNY